MLHQSFEDLLNSKMHSKDPTFSSVQIQILKNLQNHPTNIKRDFGVEFQAGKIKGEFEENDKITQPISRVILGVIFKGVKSRVILEKPPKSPN